ncbi:MAG: penicillin-binding protein [Cytophagaceae bacterium]|nr:penicillin-binding protein [Cytophagaceae bacterium]MDW8456868.1 transglycosylase domain-containing protein [Cytophagaceae bacterium]
MKAATIFYNLRQQKYGRLVIIAWTIFSWFIFNLLLFTLLIRINFLWLFGGFPATDILEDPTTDQASEVYSADGQILGKYFRENRSPVPFEKISPVVIKALIATEDTRFYEHSAIDFKAFFAIFYYMIKGDQRGSSTISQQLAKNLFKTRKDKGLLGNIPLLKILIAKAKEWMLAVELERRYTKDEIIAMYLNTVDFGSNAFGIKVASKTFFNTTPDSLTTSQAAVLIGLLKAPTLYSPKLNPKNCIKRRNLVFDLMVENNNLTPSEASELKKLPLGLKFASEDHNEGYATYFRGELSKFLNEWCEKNGRNLYSDGLKIHTTIDSRMQQYAEEAVAEHMSKLQKTFFDHWKGKNPWRYENNKEIPDFIMSHVKKLSSYKALVAQYGENSPQVKKYLYEPRRMKVFTWQGEKDTTFNLLDSMAYYKHYLHCGFMAMDPFTGEIKAWVGGINYKYFKYDHVKQSKRQPGSAFKPFVYTAAIANGYSPCYLLPDVPITFRYMEDGKEVVWSPKNADWIFTGDSITLRRAMGKSVNSVTAHLMKLIGPEEVIKYARRLGITSPLKPVPSLALGSSDVSVYEMTGAYAAFVNSGVWIEPFFVTRIEDRNGNILAEFRPKTKDALSEELAYVMVHMLKGGTEERGGTSQALFQYDIFSGNEVGGKTGTTSNHSDGWFIGITKSHVAGVWVGAEDRCVHFRTSQLGEGARVALPIFGLYMEKIYKDTSLGIKRGFFKRPKKLSININCPYRPEPIRDTIPIQEADPLDSETEEDIQNEP